MKTNQTLQLDFNGAVLEIEHKTKFGSLTDLWRIGNAMRLAKGTTELAMENYLRSPETLELIEALERKYGIYNENHITDIRANKGRLINIKSPLIKSKRGRYSGGTFAHKYILFHAAAKFGADFQIMIYEKISDFENILKALNEFEVDSEILESSRKPLFVYAIREVNTGNIKIGISASPESRLKQLQTGNSSELELVTFIEAKDRFKTEKELHLLNADKHIRGEWFDATTTIGE